MARPPLEVADPIRAAEPAFMERARLCFDRQHWKAWNAILRCRTGALGGHIDQCSRCGREGQSYNSCRNRACPKCQGNAPSLAGGPARRPAAGAVCPRSLHAASRTGAAGARQSEVVYNLLFRLSAATLIDMARDPRLLGAEIGFFSVLHT